MQGAMRALQKRALEIALQHLSIRENPGNRGVEIDKWNTELGLPLGSPYCCAHIIACYSQAAAQLSVHSPLPRTGHVGHLWMRSPIRWRTGKPGDGYIYVHFANPENPEASKGHCGIVASWSGNLFNGLEANTSAFHSVIDDENDRNGDGVHLKQRDIGYVHGFLDVAIDDLEDTNPLRALLRE